MASLAEFLLLRYTEEEERAIACMPESERHPYGDPSIRPTPIRELGEDLRGYLGGPLGEHAAAWHPLRVLAECEAKRRIVGLPLAQPTVLIRPEYRAFTFLHSKFDHNTMNQWALNEDKELDIIVGQWSMSDYRWIVCQSIESPILKLLALPYAEHPDFDESWRVD